MHIAHLSLTNFRNYIRLDFDPPPGISVFQGANAQGKTSLLEAICFLTTTRLPRVGTEKELINWDVLGEPLPFARLTANVQKAERNTQLEITLQPRYVAQHDSETIIAPIKKHIRVNGVVRRAVDLVGQLNSVMFTPRDIDLVEGEPALRRRYLDITNSQVDPQYLRSLQRYQKVLPRRNHLLRQIAAHHAREDELAFWDQELIKAGSYIIFQRQQAIAKLNELANPIHQQITGQSQALTLKYRPNINKGVSEFIDSHGVDEVFSQALSAARQRELDRGMTLAGPHRDDLSFLVNEVDMGTYGSRGEQRTIALSLKLAEAKFMLAKTGEPPVLLLDDVLSELDRQRRHHLLEAVLQYQQVLITTTDLDRFPSEFLARAEKFKVESGRIEPSPD